MKLFNTTKGPAIEQEGYCYLIDEAWEDLVNDDNLYEKLHRLALKLPPADKAILQQLLPTISPRQELWACGVTYLRSKIGRQEESKDAGGADFYAKVYEAERPEVFFKATHHRIVGHEGKVRIRQDSTWDVPEPELTLVVSSSGKIIGYTIGNDMSSRSIEGENPLYLPQAKTYDACAALGPCVYVVRDPLPADTQIQLTITRGGNTVFTGAITIDQMKRSVEELVSFVYKECSFPYGCLIMTGTGIVPGHNFTLLSGDVISITIDAIGTLVNTVQ
ncbi:fumarylacetoacetate hydrolase family protein [Paraflavitalea pollutisoli]|uniref:fumarylacetoacetate hydrolase family protein n=1 Tax=Paraflavitalea pollutisoli TaxID=3034143 RepID=UPI0023EB98A5|nr:fumarylacetoacetate hydrolase family protein [Paraflavitalea sp. H1-2-19X]